MDLGGDHGRIISLRMSLDEYSAVFDLQMRILSLIRLQLPQRGTPSIPIPTFTVHASRCKFARVERSALCAMFRRRRNRNIPETYRQFEFRTACDSLPRSPSTIQCHHGVGNQNRNRRTVERSVERYNSHRSLPSYVNPCSPRPHHIF